MADKLCHKNINNNEEERVTVTAAKVTSVTARMGGRVTKVGTTIANYIQLLPTVANYHYPGGGGGSGAAGHSAGGGATPP